MAQDPLDPSDRGVYLAYEVAQLNVPYPDVTLTLGDYRWKVHSDLLITASDFFKKALEGQFQEATSKTVALHDDNPWTIGRIVQYLYLKTWTMQNHWPNDLQRIMMHNSGVDTYATMMSDDANKCQEDILVDMINTADKYLMFELVNTISLTQTWKSCTRPGQVLGLLDKLWEEVTCERLIKYEGLKVEFTRLLSTDLNHMKATNVQAWCARDAGFGVMIINACLKKIDEAEKSCGELKTEVREWKGKAKDAEDALALCRKRKRK